MKTSLNKIKNSLPYKVVRYILIYLFFPFKVLFKFIKRESKMIETTILIIATIVGAFWALHSFIVTENKVGLSIHLTKIEHQKKEGGEFYLDFNYNVKNIGKRELAIILEKTNVKIYEIDSNMQLNHHFINDDQPFYKDTVFVMERRHSNFSNDTLIRFRSEVDYNFPYQAIIKKPGRYFIEFSITTNLDKYKTIMSKMATGSSDNVTWQDKVFYVIPNSEELE